LLVVNSVHGIMSHLGSHLFGTLEIDSQKYRFILMKPVAEEGWELMVISPSKRIKFSGISKEVSEAALKQILQGSAIYYRFFSSKQGNIEDMEGSIQLKNHTYLGLRFGTKWVVLERTPYKNYDRLLEEMIQTNKKLVKVAGNISKDFSVIKLEYDKELSLQNGKIADLKKQLAEDALLKKKFEERVTADLDAIKIKTKELVTPSLITLYSAANNNYFGWTPIINSPTYYTVQSQNATNDKILFKVKGHYLVDVQVTLYYNGSQYNVQLFYNNASVRQFFAPSHTTAHFTCSLREIIVVNNPNADYIHVYTNSGQNQFTQATNRMIIYKLD